MNSDVIAVLHSTVAVTSSVININHTLKRISKYSQPAVEYSLLLLLSAKSEGLFIVRGYLVYEMSI